MTGGVFVYALDDAYIHLGIARSLYMHHVWGVDGSTFTPASSSITWPLLLVLTGAGTEAGVLIPFVLNLVFSIAAIYLAHRFLPAECFRARGRFVALLLFVLVAPLGLLSFTGMEHVLQIVLTLLIALQAGRVISQSKTSPRSALLVAVLALLLAATRYEGLFVVAPICGLLLLSRRYIAALIVGLSGWAPIVLFGLYSKSHGWFFFPTSVLLKTAQSFQAASEASQGWAQYPIVRALETVVLKFTQQFGATPSLLFFTAATTIFFVMRRRSGIGWKDELQVLSIIFLSAALLHLSLGSVDGPAYRYEAYLDALGFLVLVRQWQAVRGLAAHLDPYLYQPWRVALCFFFLAGPRTIVANVGLPFGSRGIYEQQFQVARFLRQNYSGTTVAANDVGTVDYQGGVRTLDLFGLTSLPVARMKLDGTFSSAAMAELAEKAHVRVAVVYENWFVQYGGIPAAWIKVAEWSVPYSLVCGATRISFFAVNPAEQGRLRESLTAFRKEMPSWVTTEIN